MTSTNVNVVIFHSRGLRERYYHVETVAPVFSSRFLKHVHVSCVHIDELHIPPADVGKAAIESLHLDECNINANALSSLLRFPRNLKTLLIDENSYHQLSRDACCPPLNTQLKPFMEALSQQRHSLERLRHSCAFKNRPRLSVSELRESTQSGLSNFHVLRTLELTNHSSLHECLKVSDLAPPNIDALVLARVPWSLKGPLETVEESVKKIASAMSVQRLEIQFDPGSVLPWVLPSVRPSISGSDGLWQPSPGTDLIHLARALKELNIPVTAIAYLRVGCIPPYLYADRGELPRPEVMFCSQRFWEEETKYQKMVNEGQRGALTYQDDNLTIAAKITTGYFVGGDSN